MTSYIYNRLVSPVKEADSAYLPVISDLQKKIADIASILEVRRAEFADYFVTGKYEIIAGISIGLSLYWIYLAVFRPPGETKTKKREPIPLPETQSPPST